MKTCKKCGCVFDDSFKDCPSCNFNPKTLIIPKILIIFSFVFLFTKHWVLFLFFLIIGYSLYIYKKVEIPNDLYIEERNKRVEKKLKQIKEYEESHQINTSYKQQNATFLNSVAHYLTEDEFFDAEEVETDDNFFVDFYDITEENTQQLLKKTLKANLEMVECSKNKTSSIIKNLKTNKYYYTSLNGCTCKDYQEHGELCSHMIFHALETSYIDHFGLLNNTETKKLIDFTIEFFKETYNNLFFINNFQDLFNDEEWELLFTPELEELEKQNIIKLRKYSYEENINSHTKSYMFERVPNLKEELNNIGIKILKSKIKSDELSKILIENKVYFEKYFENICFVSISKHLQDYLSQNEDLIKYILKTHLSKNYK